MSAWSAMDAWLCWLAFCGIFVNAWLGWHAGKIGVQVVYAAACGVSIVRFTWAAGKEHGFKKRKWPHWVYAPKIWLIYSISCLASDVVSLDGPVGIWRGIGRWSVYPAKPTTTSEGGE